MQKFVYHQFLYGSDNYGVLVHDPRTNKTAAIDAGDFVAYEEELQKKGWNLSDILITHHHADHTDGLKKLLEKTGARVYGPKGTGGIYENISNKLSEGDKFEFSDVQFNVIQTPGHTLDMINYYIPSEKVCFTGDTLFSLGCGRVFEGSHKQMWESLTKLVALPSDTIIYSSHEYTEANAKFALSIDPENKKLVERSKQIDNLRKDKKPTVPSILYDELETNPFLRTHDKNIRNFLNLENASDFEVFSEIRSRKDNF